MEHSQKFNKRTGIDVETKIQSHVEIDLLKIQDNAKAIKAYCNRKLIAVVKADAYGHGAVQVADVLHNIADMFAVATVEEGIELRQAGIRNPILVLFSTLTDTVDEIISYELTPTIDNWNLATRLNEAVLGRNSLLQLVPIEKAYIHLDINTGMNRSGIPYLEVRDFIDKLQTLNRLELEGITTHLATADEEDHSFVNLQLQRFVSSIEDVEKSDTGIPFFHVANSAATISIPDSHFDAVRPGLALYGIYPASSYFVDLQPALCWKTHVSWVSMIDSGEGISYGLTHKVKQPTRIAAIQVGYGDGYPRSLSNKGEVLINGIRRPILGRICMDITVVGLETTDHVEIGDEVILIGKQGDAEITVDEIAKKTETIPYEILTQIGKRVKRIYA
ncbi:alanine racemase [Candidatus Poribacteria bacterium]|nr:MAG: alanine racemase [Candidatus Poribacteria bacterium]